MDATSSRSASSSSSGMRGWCGLGAMARTGISKSAELARLESIGRSSGTVVVPGMSASSPRPRPKRCLGMSSLRGRGPRDDFLSQILVGQRTRRARIVIEDGLAEAGRLRQPYVARDHRLEPLAWEMLAD